MSISSSNRGARRKRERDPQCAHGAGRLPIPIITRVTFDSPYAVIRGFDFTVARA
jgi:hypothetical protein